MLQFKLCSKHCERRTTHLWYSATNYKKYRVQLQSLVHALRINYWIAQWPLCFSLSFIQSHDAPTTNQNLRGSGVQETEENKGITMMHAMSKGTFQIKPTSSSEDIAHNPLHCWLKVSVSIKFRKFHTSFLEWSRVNLKRFLCLTMQNQCCQTFVKEMWQNTPNHRLSRGGISELIFTGAFLTYSSIYIFCKLSYKYW